ncbi:general substrate transporter [Microdochium trichocladiopsis]|uniref:General substrate transporter n=1 Tax=Microdochium trichocladiopsis TaxID=1682393 RepID=A0A9P8YHI3_9PEZI|nr:general substrate transporter [Microdochium trichocladiopsis]KAH7038250.1 general substrate transporter [Microdochium trichocladiopsis]
MLLCRLRCVPLWLSASCITALNAMVFGLDTGTIGPVTTMSSFVQTFGHFSATVHGVVVSSILITGVLAALIVGNLADRYGRTRIIVIGSAIFGLGSAIETCSFHLPVFIVGRLIKGAGEGCFLSTVYVLTAELSPAKQRGAVTNLAGVAITTGIVLGFFMCYGTARLYADEDDDTLKSLQWRLPIAVQSCIALSNAALTGLLVPQSPRWLLATGKAEQARQLIAKLGLSDAEAAELLEPSSSSSSSADGTSSTLAHPPSLSLWHSILQTLLEFRTALSPPARNRTLFGCFIMACQQFAGIDGVLYYAPLLFAQAGMDSEQATFLASGVSGLVILAATIPSTILCDMWGRKTAAITGGLGLAGTMLLIGSLYAANGRESGKEMPQAAKWTVVVMIYLYAVVFTSTWALVFRMYMIESLPRASRSSGSALAQASNWLANYMVALTTPVFLASSSFGAYYFWGFTSLFCTGVCCFVMRETRGRSLEVIEKEYLDEHEHLREQQKRRRDKKSAEKQQGGAREEQQQAQQQEDGVVVVTVRGVPERGE